MKGAFYAATSFAFSEFFGVIGIDELLLGLLIVSRRQKVRGL